MNDLFGSLFEDPLPPAADAPDNTHDENSLEGQLAAEHQMDCTSVAAGSFRACELHFTDNVCDLLVCLGAMH